MLSLQRSSSSMQNEYDYFLSNFLAESHLLVQLLHAGLVRVLVGLLRDVVQVVLDSHLGLARGARALTPVALALLDQFFQTSQQLLESFLRQRQRRRFVLQIPFR